MLINNINPLKNNPSEPKKGSTNTQTKPSIQIKRYDPEKLISDLDTLAIQNKQSISSLDENSKPTKEEIERRKKELTNIKNLYGQNVIDFDVADFLSQSDDETYDLILQLANIKNKYNANTFYGCDIMDLLRIDKKACKRALELANLKNANNEPLFNSVFFIKYFTTLNDEIYNLALNLVKTKDKNGKNIFSPPLIRIITDLNPETRKTAIELVNLKDLNNNRLLSIQCFETIANAKDTSIYARLLKAIKDNNINHKINEIKYKQLQNNAGTLIKLISHIDDFSKGTEIDLTYIINPDGSITKERIENYDAKTAKSWNSKGNSSFLDNRDFFFVDNERFQILNSQIEIIYDEKTKQPKAILTTKNSDILKGVYEQTLYTLSDYDENYDVLKAIKDGSIRGGKKLSEVKQNDDGSITYQENINSNGFNIKRYYKKGINNIDYEYSFKITDENKNKILDTNISFKKNSENQTTTIINGKTFSADFDDETKLIKIKGPNRVETIDFNEISPDNKTTWEAVKNLPINLIQILKNTCWGEIVDDLESCTYTIDTPNRISENLIEYEIQEDEDVSKISQIYDEQDNTISILVNGMINTTMNYNPDDCTLKVNGETIQLNNVSKEQIKQIPLYYIIDFVDLAIDKKIISKYISRTLNDNIVFLLSRKDLSIIAHELGHIQDYAANILNADENLISIYNDEIAKFNLKHTNTSGKNYIDYFSQTGGSGSTGLSELIAETNMLLNTYGCQYEIIKDRAQFLVQNFPKTMAYIATKFNLNMV